MHYIAATENKPQKTATKYLPIRRVALLTYTLGLIPWRKGMPRVLGSQRLLSQTVVVCYFSLARCRARAVDWRTAPREHGDYLE